jgi:hypothetical protein
LNNAVYLLSSEHCLVDETASPLRKPAAGYHPDWGWGTQMCVFFLLGVEDGGADVHLSHAFKFMLSLRSVSDVRNT